MPFRKVAAQRSDIRGPLAPRMSDLHALWVVRPYECRVGQSATSRPNGERPGHRRNTVADMCLWGLASSHPPQRSRWLRLVALLAVLAATLVVRLPTAQATMGVDDYPKRLKHAGLDALVDPWLFYNRECTSFVAWRLNNDAGAPFTNYYLGEHWGDASNWRHAANQADVTVNDIPAVGAIAWWRAGSAGSSRGHVAWVESVSGSSIEIEEYNYATSGGYGTRTIYSGDSVWPSAFIHIGGISLRSDKRPTVTGTPQVGRRMTATRGTWKPTGATFTYQWLAGGVEIPGATHKVFAPRASQVADSIQVRVTATKPGLDPASTVSSATAKVKRGVFAPGKDPGIAGTAQVGVQLRAKSGSWTPTGRYSYQWFAGHDPIAGATKPVFTPPATKLGQPIRVRVTAHRRGYRPARGASEPTAEVRPGVFANAAPPSVDGLPQVGQPLSADVGEWTPKGKARYQWLVDGSAVDGATARTYK